jgi:hypothetical protein
MELSDAEVTEVDGEEAGQCRGTTEVPFPAEGGKLTGEKKPQA